MLRWIACWVDGSQFYELEMNCEIMNSQYWDPHQYPYRDCDDMTLDMTSDPDIDMTPAAWEFFISDSHDLYSTCYKHTKLNLHIKDASGIWIEVHHHIPKSLSNWVKIPYGCWFRYRHGRSCFEQLEIVINTKQHLNIVLRAIYQFRPWGDQNHGSCISLTIMPSYPWGIQSLLRRWAHNLHGVISRCAELGLDSAMVMEYEY